MQTYARSNLGNILAFNLVKEFFVYHDQQARYRCVNFKHQNRQMSKFGKMAITFQPIKIASWHKQHRNRQSKTFHLICNMTRLNSYVRYDVIIIDDIFGNIICYTRRVDDVSCLTVYSNIIYQIDGNKTAFLAVQELWVYDQYSWCYRHWRKRVLCRVKYCPVCSEQHHSIYIWENLGLNLVFNTSAWNFVASSPWALALGTSPYANSFPMWLCSFASGENPVSNFIIV